VNIYSTRVGFQQHSRQISTALEVDFPISPRLVDFQITTVLEVDFPILTELVDFLISTSRQSTTEQTIYEM
jgi:hypothetical protein